MPRLRVVDPVGGTLICQGGRMAANRTRLQGEVSEDPASKPKDVEKLILGFVQALAQEIRVKEGIAPPAPPAEVAPKPTGVEGNA